MLNDLILWLFVTIRYEYNFHITNTMINQFFKNNELRKEESLQRLVKAQNFIVVVLKTRQYLQKLFQIALDRGGETVK